MGEILNLISRIIVPMIILSVIGYGLLMKVAVYDAFIEGAKKGFTTVLQIMPTLVGLMIAVGILRESGFLEFLANQISVVTDCIRFPAALVPLTLIKMFSSSAATGLLLDIYQEYGTDSSIGRIGSIMMSSTETIFYTMSIYFLTAKVSKTRWTLAGALVATLAGVIVSVFLGA